MEKNVNSGIKILDYETSCKLLGICSNKTDDNKCSFSLNRMEEYKNRGLQVIKPSLKKNWVKMLNEFFTDNNGILYNVVIIEAALSCMETLTFTNSVSKTYDIINMNDGKKVIFCDIELSFWMVDIVSNIISIFHENGQEFIEYRKKEIKTKIKTRKLCI